MAGEFGLEKIFFQCPLIVYKIDYCQRDHYWRRWTYNLTCKMDTKYDIWRASQPQQSSHWLHWWHKVSGKKLLCSTESNLNATTNTQVTEKSSVVNFFWTSEQKPRWTVIQRRPIKFKRHQKFLSCNPTMGSLSSLSHQKLQWTVTQQYRIRIRTSPRTFEWQRKTYIVNAFEQTNKSRKG